MSEEKSSVKSESMDLRSISEALLSMSAPETAASISAEKATEIICGARDVLLKSTDNKIEDRVDTNTVLASLQLLCKMCRQEVLVKSTSNYANIVVCAESDVCNVVTLVLAANLRRAEIVEHCAMLIMILASDNTATQKAFLDAGACEQIVLALREKFDAPNVIEYLLRAGRNLASNLPIASQLISDGISEEVFSTVESNIDNPAIVEAALWLIVNLSCDADAATILGVTGICLVVCNILERWMDHVSIAQGSCWAIRNLSVAAACNYSALAATNIVRVLITTVRIHATNVDVCESGLWALANIACDRELSMKIVEEGAVPALAEISDVILTRDRDLMLTEAMFGLLAVDEAYLWAVRNISSGAEDNNLSFNVDIIQKCVILLLREHGRDPRMAEVALGAVSSLIFKNGGAAVAMGPMFIVEAVAQVTCGHFQNDFVLMTGLKTLFFLCDHYRDRLREIGIDKLGAASVKAYADNDEIVRYGCELLLNVFYTDDASRAALLAASAIDNSGRVVKIDSVEARNEAWIPDAQVRANEWFVVSNGDDAEEEDGKDFVEQKEPALEDGEEKKYEDSTADEGKK